MIRLARSADKPLLLHERGMTGRLLELLREEQADCVGGICHAFNGSLETARELISLGFALGIGGVVTFAEAHRLPEVIRQVPPEWLVLETDAPDMPPHPHRGTKNRPEYLTLVASRVAELKGWTMAETARITTGNARRILQLG
jgi:TatD DNase family protein